MKRPVLVSSFVSALALAWASPSFAQPLPPLEPADRPPEPAQPPAVGRPAPVPPPERDSAADTGRALSAAPDEKVIVATPSVDAFAVSPDHPAEGPPRYDLIRINMGLRIGYLPSRAFDTFASNDVLAQFSIDGTYPVLTKGKLVVGAGVGWDVGGRSDTVRGFASSVTAHRLYIPIEGRWNVSSGLYAFGKVSPGVAAAIASVQDPSAPNELSATGWAFSADASLGASILLGPRKRMDKRSVRIWVTPELGYAYTTDAPLHVGPHRDDKDVLGSDQSTSFRSLALSGFFWRASVGTTF